ncbi:hypothetical protein PTKIN_Ptkin19aG0098900 [Pterospermum kingtungense]
MADPNFIVPAHENPYYTPYTDDFMNIVASPLIPQPSEKSKEAMDIGSSEAMEFWDLYNESNLGYSPAKTLGINGETSNPKETNLGNQSLIQEPFSFPLPIPQSGENSIPEFNWGMSNQRETNMGNEIADNQNLTMPEDLTGQEPFSFPSLVPRFTEDIWEAIGPLKKTIISGGVCNESNDLNSQVRCSKTFGETSNQRETNLGKQQSLDYMDSRQLSVWPSVQVPFGCSCCEILREIVHTKDSVVMKLQIHGKLVGIFFHAILDVQVDSKAVSNEMFDFYDKNFDEVKQFLTQYCIKRKQEGFTMMKDPRSSFFQVLCIGYGWDDGNLPDDDCTEKTLSPGPEDIQMDEATNDSNEQEKSQAANSNNKGKSPISLTEQRKRVKEMTFKDLANYFHLPRKEAAQKLGLSETVVHNIWCKSGGGKRRWPYRKVHSLEKEISELKALLNSDNPVERVHATNEIQRKEEEMAELYREAA